MIKIDGSYLEGGGQIARTALALSALTGKSFEVDNIRRGRCDSGLKAQHLHCIKALKQLCNAKTNEIKLGSEYLRFIPGKFKAKSLNIDIGTAGSISLLIQSLLLPCLFHKIKLTITGGTDGKWAMPYDYFNEVFISQIRDYADIDVKLMKRGYYPKGGGKIELTIKPKYKFDNLPDKPISLVEQGKLLQIKGISHASKNLQTANVAERQAKEAESILNKYHVPIDIRTEYCDTFSAGSGIVLWAKFEHTILGSDGLGKRGKRAEIVGEEAANSLIKEIESKAAVDSHLEDNLIPYMALFGGKIKVNELTNHTKTNIFVVEKFLDVKFKIKDKVISV